MLRINVSPIAKIDIQEAARYYNRQQAGLGRRFERAVLRTFNKIRQMPRSASFAYDSVRYKVVEHFPFVVIYEEEVDNIIILRVFNEKLDPKKLK